jgi:hypothetical protein
LIALIVLANEHIYRDAEIAAQTTNQIGRQIPPASKLPSDDRAAYFEQAAAQRGITAQIVEKEFWVCWGLRRLFSLTEFRDP